MAVVTAETSLHIPRLHMPAVISIWQYPVAELNWKAVANCLPCFWGLVGWPFVSELGVRGVSEQPFEQLRAGRQTVHQADTNCRQVWGEIPVCRNTQTVRRGSCWHVSRDGHLFENIHFPCSKTNIYTYTHIHTYIHTYDRLVLHVSRIRVNSHLYLLALLGAHHILHVSRIRVKSHLPSAGIIRSSTYSPR